MGHSGIKAYVAKGFAMGDAMRCPASDDKNKGSDDPCPGTSSMPWWRPSVTISHESTTLIVTNQQTTRSCAGLL